MSQDPSGDEDKNRARNRRSIAIALGLVAFVILVFVVSYVRISGASTHYAPHF